MTRHLFAWLVLLACSPGWLWAADDKPLAGDLKDLQGEWQATAFELGGNNLPDEAVKAFRLTIKGTDFSFHKPEGSDEQKATLTLDEKKTPKTIDLAPSTGSEQGKTIRGIYALDGDKLRLCIPNHPAEATEYPKDFKGGDPGDCAVISLERVKEKEKEKDK